jgi:hypothetical protein
MPPPAVLGWDGAGHGLAGDIDGNDYWVWRSIQRYAPRVVVIEHNATFPPPTDWVMTYDPAYRWNGVATSGASLQALERLGQAKGYALVGCALGGVNAFFVRRDLLADHFLAYRHTGHRRSYEAFSRASGDVRP